MGMNSSQCQSAVADGAIGASCFVERDPNGTNLQRVIQGTANCRSLGIGPPYSVADGQELPYAYSGLEWLTMGGSGKAGDRIKSDSSGHGVVIGNGGSTPQNVGAFATEDFSSGDVILVQIENYTVQPGDYLS
jgi:hypothetical protein